MQKIVDHTEAWLGRYWVYIGLGTLCLIMLGCAHSIVTPDGTVEVVGKDLIPGVLPDDGVIRDVLGAANDAVQNIDAEQIIEAVSGGDWWTVIGVAGGALLSIFGGLRVRQALRKKS